MCILCMKTTSYRKRQGGGWAEKNTVEGVVNIALLSVSILWACNLSFFLSIIHHAHQGKGLGKLLFIMCTYRKSIG